MNRTFLIGLGLVVAIGLIYIATKSGPGSTEDEVAAAPGSQRETPAAENTAPAPDSMPPENPGADSPGPEPAPSPRMEARMPDPRVTRADGKVYMNDPITLARQMHTEATTPMDDVNAVGTALRYYQLVYKENPVGSLNVEILGQLTGGNPKGIVVIPPDHPDINGKGELVDRWGTPYFFHGLTRTAMDVWSAGPDHKFGTIDDVKLGVDEEFGEALGLVIDP